ncbi:hypothetical protein AGLY_000035 [Aphis glycines]|uniref:Endonuclease/exonuclease/phosphatase domain-containing protein n=1 Tax=Aphis glycines TaxID=307491 RepID=A0A6G0U5Z4_APHGL|nr:hypothetical protein AGLY_000035 [Aphis glycines]
MNDEDDDTGDDDLLLPYSDFRRFRRAHKYFEDKFINNPFGYPCSVCDRLWFQQDLKPAVSPSQYFGTLVTSVGDICFAECKRPNGQIILIVAVYISPNSNIPDIIRFLHKSLLPYTPVGGSELGTGEDKIPIILSGDFNVRFDCPESQPLTDFLRQKFNLTMNNNPTIPTTRSGTTIDAIFTRYLNNVQSQNYISYFSYHKPIITVVPIEPQNPEAQIQEISL